MTAVQSGWLIIAIAFIAANLPWLSERVLLVLEPKQGVKRAAWRWLEWLLLFFIVGAVALGMEQKLNGEIYPQGWEFYAVGLCLFLVFALPGFIYRHDLRQLWQRR
ncbi:MAG: DUF2818 family protein [Gammaproteobacteria bacterium]|nr:DUF2818 family protein [Gammaproteobacteria bacterium]